MFFLKCLKAPYHTICRHIFPFAIICVCVCVSVYNFSFFQLHLSTNILDSLTGIKTHFLWKINHHHLQSAVLQDQPGGISTWLSFMKELWQAFRVTSGHFRPREDQRASNKWSSGHLRLSYWGRASNNWTTRKQVTGAKEQIHCSKYIPASCSRILWYILSIQTQTQLLNCYFLSKTQGQVKYIFLFWWVRIV